MLTNSSGNISVIPTIQVVISIQFTTSHFTITFQHHFQRYDIGNCMAFPTVRNRGRGYSNRFTLCRGCTLVPQHLITSVRDKTPNNRNSVRGSSTVNLSLTHPSIGTSPHELGLPVKTNRQPGNCTGLGPDIHLISRHFTFNGGSLGITPMTLVQREPILKYISFQLSLTQIQVLWGYL